MMQKETIYLTEELLIGKGARKDVYINPKNPAQCIKINARDDGDHRVEMNYRRSRELRNLPPSALMVSYYGAVETNLGPGYVFERIVDYDGMHSKTIEELIKLELKARNENSSVRKLLGTDKEYPKVTDVLLRFRKELFQDNIIIGDMWPYNFMVQFNAPSKWRVRIVDDFGTSSWIPIMYYIDYFGAKHVRRYWCKFIRRIISLYPGLLTDDESHDLMKEKGN